MKKLTWSSLRTKGKVLRKYNILSTECEGHTGVISTRQVFTVRNDRSEVVQSRPRLDIDQLRSQARLVNNRFTARLKMFFFFLSKNLAITLNDTDWQSTERLLMLGVFKKKREENEKGILYLLLVLIERWAREQQENRAGSLGTVLGPSGKVAGGKCLGDDGFSVLRLIRWGNMTFTSIVSVEQKWIL